jgi:hypothetical protein
MNFKPIKYIHNGLYFEVHATLDNHKLGSLGHNIFHSDPGDGTEHIRLSKSEAEEYVSEIVRAVNTHDQLVEALDELMALIENNTLVRNISRDGDPDWAIRQLPLVMTLKKAQAALKSAKQ